MVLPIEPVLGKPKKLLDQACDVIRLKHYSLRTERTYCDWIEQALIQYSSKAWAGVIPKC